MHIQTKGNCPMRLEIFFVLFTSCSHGLLSVLYVTQCLVEVAIFVIAIVCVYV